MHFSFGFAGVKLPPFNALIIGQDDPKCLTDHTWLLKSALTSIVLKNKSIIKKHVSQSYYAQMALFVGLSSYLVFHKVQQMEAECLA